MKSKVKKDIREITKTLMLLDEQDLVLIKHGAMALECKKQIENAVDRKNEKEE